MPRPAWQKSSFSGGGEGECIELAATATGRVHLRESDRPDDIATSAPHALAGLLLVLKNESWGPSRRR
ncbi:DUF397 domain-containing protein [Streptomyces sp. NPDC005236]|uniref:DUF397 domain-containing protein n=1 Tax=Streptomyces sp. NPDC005236 TaxID=3157028 RepID=UPI0033A95B82